MKVCIYCLVAALLGAVVSWGLPIHSLWSQSNAQDQPLKHINRPLQNPLAKISTLEFEPIRWAESQDAIAQLRDITDVDPAAHVGEEQ